MKNGQGTEQLWKFKFQGGLIKQFTFRVTEASLLSCNVELGGCETKV